MEHLYGPYLEYRSYFPKTISEWHSQFWFTVNCAKKGKTNLDFSDLSNNLRIAP